MAPRFVKVLPNDYQRVLDTLKKVKASGGVTDDEAELIAFGINAQDAARMGGN
jgi:hypothetical protein